MRKSGVWILAATLMLAHGYGVELLAQEAEDTPEQTDQSVPAETEDTPADPSSADSSSADPSPVDNAQANEAEQPAGETLDTFVPSEEVSSDLSVSFPVDI